MVQPLTQVSDIYGFIEKNRKKLRPSIQNNIWRNNKHSLKYDEIDDLISDVMVATVEKLMDGRKKVSDWESDSKLINYLNMAVCRKFTRDNENSKKFITGYTQDYATMYDTYDAPENNEPDFSTGDAYKKMLEYLDTKYDWIEIGVFKTYALNNISFSQLQEITGFSRGKCYQIVKEIRDDLKANRHKFIDS